MGATSVLNFPESKKLDVAITLAKDMCALAVSENVSENKPPWPESQGLAMENSEWEERTIRILAVCMHMAAWDDSDSHTILAWLEKSGKRLQAILEAAPSGCDPITKEMGLGCLRRSAPIRAALLEGCQRVLLSFLG